jgi:predicted transcriptional regulator
MPGPRPIDSEISDERAPAGEPEKLAEVRQLFAPSEPLSTTFHMVNRALPDGQEVVFIPPEMPASKALAIMNERGFSQLPVVQGKQVLGLFSYRAFAIEVARMDTQKFDAKTLPVEEFLQHERPSYARLTDEIDGLLDSLDAHDAVVVSGPDQLVAILTPMDVLRYVYSMAASFALIEEIELSLRKLIPAAVPDPEGLRECVANALAEKYKEGKRPELLEDMSFDDFIALLRDGRNWPRFEKVFGGTRERTSAKLAPVRDLRNAVFHFRRELTEEDRQQLVNCRNWLLLRVRNEEAKREGAR